MGTYYESQTVFDYDWTQVVKGYWNRYPNPMSTHVLTEDTIAREVRDGKLYTRRLLSKTNPVPKWGERFYNSKSVKILEDSVLDPKRKSLITYTRNVGFKKIMRVEERVEYLEQEDGKTLAVRTAYISSQVFGFSRAIRALGVERFKSNCLKASNGFNYVLYNMYARPLQNIDGLKVSEHIPSNVMTQQTTMTQHASSKVEAIKRSTKTSYEYLKSQVSRISQLFSVKN